MLAQTPDAAAAFVRMLGPYLLPTAVVLDYGAGRGELTLALLAAGYRTAALETDPVQRAVLLERVGGHPGFLGLVPDLPERHYDGVLFVDTLERLPPGGLDGTLSDLHERVRPGGIVIASAVNRQYATD